MTTLKTHRVPTLFWAEAYLREQGFCPLRTTVWVGSDSKSVAFISYECEDVVNIIIRTKV